MNRSQVACWFSLRKLVKDGWAYLWTLTTPDITDPKELSRRWRQFIWNGFTPCVRVFEKHTKGHGYHIHFVTAVRLDVDELRVRIERAGFGRFNVRRIPGKKAKYIAKYLTKRAQHCPGVRRWACVGFKGTKTKSIRCNNSHWDELKMIMERFPAPNGYNFFAKVKLAEEHHHRLWWDALDNQRNPDYQPPFPALYRHWVQSPLTSLGKNGAPFDWAKIREFLHKKWHPQGGEAPRDQTIPLPLEI